MLTPAQAAAILQLSRRTIVNMCARGDLPSRLIAGGWRINRDELLRMITTAPAR
jgi:excisionase family DNA binding protein